MVKRANKRTNRRTKKAQKEDFIRSKFKKIIESIDVSECAELYRKYQGSASTKKQKGGSQKGGSQKGGSQEGGSQEDMGTTEIYIAILMVVVCGHYLRGERFRHFLELIFSISGLN